MLLCHDDLPPVDVQNREGASPFVFICDHAGQRVPRALGSLGLSDDELASHIAWDIGAGGVSRRLAVALDGCSISQRYSRLVIDCNRSLTAVDSITTRSERTVIPGNLHVSPSAATSRAREVFQPYHDEVGETLARRDRQGRRTVLVAMHSFTPVLLDVTRPWHVGVLHDRDVRLAEPVLRMLRREGDLVVGDNEPYAANDGSDFSIVLHGERRGTPYVELEIRQDLLAGDADQIVWAHRLARILVAAHHSMSSMATQRAR